MFLGSRLYTETTRITEIFTENTETLLRKVQHVRPSLQFNNERTVNTHTDTAVVWMGVLSDWLDVNCHSLQIHSSVRSILAI